MRSIEFKTTESRMKKLFITLLTASVFFGMQFANAAACKYQEQSVDPVTNEKYRQTAWDKVASGYSGTKNVGSISAIAKGDERYLAVKIGVADFYPFPDELRQEAVSLMDEKTLEKYEKMGTAKRFRTEVEHLEGPIENQDYRDFLDFLLGESLLIPKGSTLELRLDDQSTLVLTTEERIRERANYTEPFEEKKMRGFGALMASVAASAVGAEITVSAEYMVDGYMSILYPLNAKALDQLSRAAVTSLRVEARDRYYTLGKRNSRYETVIWSKKSNLKIRNALKCVE